MIGCFQIFCGKTTFKYCAEVCTFSAGRLCSRKPVLHLGQGGWMLKGLEVPPRNGPVRKEEGGRGGEREEVGRGDSGGREGRKGKGGKGEEGRGGGEGAKS